ncbi:MAG: ATP synthase F0 subunit B [Candidatus Bruticola sp.]
MDIILALLKNMGSEPLMIGVQVCLFYVFHILMSQILYKPMLAARRERKAQTADKVSEAWGLNEKTIKAKTEYEEKVRLARKKALEQVQAAQKEADAIRQERLTKAKAESEAIIEKAKAEIKDERLRAEAELDSAVAALASQAAMRILSGLTSGRERERVEKFVKESVE